MDVNKLKIIELEDRIKELETELKMLKTEKACHQFEDGSLNDSLDKVPLLIKNSNDILLLINSHGEQIFISDAVERITGYSANDLKGQFASVICPDDLEMVLQAWNKDLVNDGAIARLQYRHKHKEKVYVWVEAVAQNFLRHPDVNAVVVNVRDISERKDFELKLQENEMKFREIIRQINDGIVVYDQQGKIIIWNQGAEKVLGFTAAEVIGRNIVDIQFQLSSHLSIDRPYLETIVSRILKLESPELFNHITDHEVQTSYSAKPRNIQSTVFPIHLSGYNLFCSVFRDTTEVKDYEKRLLQLNNDKDNFLSVLAHDLRSPFHSLLGFLDLLSANLHEYDIYKIERQIKIISKSSARIFDLLESILLWGRAKSGKLLFLPQQLDFLTVCNDVIATQKISSSQKDIAINSFAAGKISVYADEDMLKTILRNLVSNAVKFTNLGGKIVIFAEQNDQSITISVSDNGIGMTTQKVESLFDFSKINTTPGTDNELGTGLGLLICSEFVEKHGGHIWVESEFGVGSSFLFTLPNGIQN
jgi:PAS domain S-box-containing protein